LTLDLTYLQRREKVLSMEDEILYNIGANYAGNVYKLAIADGLDHLIALIDYYKGRAIKHCDSFSAGIAEGLWALAQRDWEYVPCHV